VPGDGHCFVVEAGPQKIEFAIDSALEGDGFEPSVPRRGDGCRHPARPLQDKKRRMLEHAGGTADREIALLTGGYGMSRVVRLM
jgi:hypothetical protein